MEPALFDAGSLTAQAPLLHTNVTREASRPEECASTCAWATFVCRNGGVEEVPCLGIRLQPADAPDWVFLLRMHRVFVAASAGQISCQRPAHNAMILARPPRRVSDGKATCTCGSGTEVAARGGVDRARPRLVRPSRDPRAASPNSLASLGQFGH